MDVNDLVSIIVPVFNAQKEVRRCLDSLKEQSYKEIEVIIIDDGSTDESLNICKEYASVDKRVNVYHIDNQGVSSARNYGIDKATGKWIVFIDADDKLASDAVEIALSIIKDKEVDILCWNSYYETDGKLSKMNSFMPEDKVYEHDELTKLSYGLYCNNRDEYYGDYFRAVWGKLFKTSLIKDNRIMFPSGIRIGEDALFLLECFNHADRVRLVNLFLYYYNYNAFSVTGKYKKDFQEYQVQEYNALRRSLNTHHLDVKNVSRQFWHKAEREFIKNELKSGDSLIPIAKRVRNWIIADQNIYRYLSAIDEDEGIKGKIRSLLIRARMLWIVAVYDTRRMRKQNLHVN